MRAKSYFIVLLGLILLMGCQTARDDSFDRLDASALFEIGVKHRDAAFRGGDPARAVQYFRAAAERGHIEAQKYFARMYMTGFGVPKDDGEALRYLEMAAAQGDAEASNQVGTMYREGVGASQDPVRAEKAFRYAAEHFDPPAMDNLAALYEAGAGVQQSNETAYYWRALAAALGHGNGVQRRYEAGTKLTRRELDAIERRVEEIWSRRAPADGAGTPLVRRLAGKWGTNDTSLTGTVQTVQGQTSGTLTTTSPDGTGGCSGSYSLSSPAGTWLLSCKSGIKAAGTLMRVNAAGSLSGVGVDSRKRRIEFVIVPQTGWPRGESA